MTPTQRYWRSYGDDPLPPAPRRWAMQLHPDQRLGRAGCRRNVSRGMTSGPPKRGIRGV